MKSKTSFTGTIVSILLLACSSSKISDPKQELTEAFKAQKIDASWPFQTVENDSMKISVLKNNAIKDQIFLSTPDTSIVYGYFLEQNKLTRDSRLFKSKLIRKDSLLYFELTNPDNKPIGSIDFPIMENKIPEDNDGSNPPPSTCPYNSLQECLDHFKTTQQYQDLHEQADKTCKTVRGAIICCVRNNGSYCVLIAISPKSDRCRIYPYENILTR